MEIWAAIDLSGKEACFSAGSFPDRKILADSSFPMKGRDSSSLLEKIEGFLGELSLSARDVARWTAGTGPGNYTGLRIVSALVSGIAFERDNVCCRGIPSAHAVLADLARDGDGAAMVVYPYETGRIFSYGATVAHGKISAMQEMSGVFTAGELLEKFPGVRHAVFERDLLSLPEQLARDAVVIAGFPVHNLLFAEPDMWIRDTVKDLIYMRPAVNVAPMHIRTEI